MLTATTVAQTPLGTVFTYQGRLKNGGSPAGGLHDLRFRLYDAPAGGNQVGTTVCRDNVSVTDGLFTVPLDFGAQFAGQERFMEIDVRADTGLGCGNPAGFVVLTPRQALTAAPNALFALNADRLDGLDSTAFLQSIPVPLTLSGTSDTHIIRVQNASSTHYSTAVFGESTGTGNTYGVFGQSPNGRGVYGTTVRGIGVFGEATDTGSFTTYGVYGASSGQFGIGVFGFAGDAGTAGNTTGVWGETASTIGIGVRGRATAATGVTYGGEFHSNSTSGLGVFGQAGTASNWTNFNAPAGVWGDAADGNGVLGTATNGTGVAGVSTFGRGVFAFSQSGDALEAVASGQNRTAVYGHHDGATGPANGVLGQSASTGGRGVFGQATAGAGITYGGWFESASPNGRSAYGVATAGSGVNFGVFGQSNSTSGTGVYALSAASSGNTYGLYGSSFSSDGYGVYCSGRFGASGTKSFRIDHPDDPTNKYLVHYSAESPEVINFYAGKVVIDGAGEAVVELPHYFAKINRDPRYTLTAVGAPMPMLHVAEEIDEAALTAGAKAEPGEPAPVCSFRIAGGAPGAKVSWEVKAVRNDRWVQQHGAPVEVDKQDLEKGTYQHPELYGQPPEKGMNYDAEHERPSPAAPPEATPR
jgi:hypothetical protein